MLKNSIILLSIQKLPTFALLCLSVSLAGCATRYKDTPPVYHTAETQELDASGRNTYTTNYQEVIKSYMQGRQKHSESTRHRPESNSTKGYKSAQSLANTGFHINAKSIYEDYVGENEYYFNIKNGNSIYCRNSTAYLSDSTKWKCSWHES